MSPLLPAVLEAVVAPDGGHLRAQFARAADGADHRIAAADARDVGEATHGGEHAVGAGAGFKVIRQADVLGAKLGAGQIAAALFKA